MLSNGWVQCRTGPASWRWITAEMSRCGLHAFHYISSLSSLFLSLITLPLFFSFPLSLFLALYLFRRYPPFSPLWSLTAYITDLGSVSGPGPQTADEYFAEAHTSDLHWLGEEVRKHARDKSLLFNKLTLDQAQKGTTAWTAQFVQSLRGLRSVVVVHQLWTSIYFFIFPVICFVPCSISTVPFPIVW